MIRNSFKRNGTLLAHVKREGPVTTHQVADRFGWKMPYAYKQLQALSDEGLLTSRIVRSPRLPGHGIEAAWEAAG